MPHTLKSNRTTTVMVADKQKKKTVTVQGSFQPVNLPPATPSNDIVITVSSEASPQTLETRHAAKTFSSDILAGGERLKP